MNQPRNELLLQRYTVRLTVPGKEGWGTGFFVTPELILTCAHVVRASYNGIVNISWQEHDQRIDTEKRHQEAVVEKFSADLLVFWLKWYRKIQNNPLVSVETLVWFTSLAFACKYKIHDLALLRIDKPFPKSFYVPLKDDVRPRDELYTYGYTDESRRGDSSTAECEGPRDEARPLIKFKGTNVRPGLSGAPLLNYRTGMVCGIVKSTRDRGSVMGGEAIPTSVILEEFPELKKLQRKFHRQNSSWFSRPNPESCFWSSVAMTIGVVILRSMGVMQPLELSAYDWLMRLRPYEPWDERVQVVGITKRDLKGWGSEVIPNDKLEQLLATVQTANPRVIGLDIFRDKDYPNPSNQQQYNALLNRIQQSDCTSQKNCIIVSCWVTTQPRKIDEKQFKAYPGIQPPPGASLHQLSFADVVPDGQTTKVVRRQLLTMNVESSALCPAEIAFSHLLAKQYLAKQRIRPMISQNAKGQDFLKIGQKNFVRLWSVNPPWDATGGYQKHDPKGNYDLRGYQIMLNYRSKSAPPAISYDDVLSGKARKFLRDQVVLIGYTEMLENGYKDLHATPYSQDTSEEQKMAGVILHAHMTSQVLSAVLDNRPLIQGWSRVAEFFWILFWALVGGWLAWWLRFTWFSPVLRAFLVIGFTFSVIGVLCVWLLTVGYWVPFIPSGVALLSTIPGAFLTDTIRTRRSLTPHQN